MRLRALRGFALDLEEAGYPILAHEQLAAIVAASLPYMACALALVGLIVAVPEIATWLPCQFEKNVDACLGRKSSFEYYLIAAALAVCLAMYLLTRRGAARPAAAEAKVSAP